MCKRAKLGGGERVRTPGGFEGKYRQDVASFSLWRRSFPRSLLRLQENPAVCVQTLERCRRGAGQREVTGLNPSFFYTTSLRGQMRPNAVS